MADEYPINVYYWDDEDEIAYSDDGEEYYYWELIPSPDYTKARFAVDLRQVKK